MAWQVELLRLTAFPPGALDIATAQGWWEKAIGRPPDNSSLDRRTGVMIEEGALQGEGAVSATLTLQVQPLRIDWRLHAVEMQMSGPPGPWSLVGSYGEVRPQFSQLLLPWVQMGVELKRLAFGGVLLFPVNRAAEGYEELSRFLSPSIEASVTDFLYQVNRRRMSNVLKDLQVNRLSKWSVARSDLILFQVQAGPGTPGTSVNTTQSGFAARLEFDINSDPEWPSDLSSEHLGALFEEFGSLADEIAEKGDVP